MAALLASLAVFLFAESAVVFAALLACSLGVTAMALLRVTRG